MTEHVDIKQLQQNIHSVVANLRALGEVEDGHKALAEVKREFEHWQRNLAMLEQEYAEAERARNKVAQAAQDKAQECERLDAEIRRKSAELANVSAQMNRIRQQLGG